MKIEIGESLFYSWLRHVKDCQVVQTNWKVSPQWNLQHETELEALMQSADELFSRKYNYSIFKKNSSMAQILQQGECDVIGISIHEGFNCIYAVDVAFHENGLNYGSREATVMKVIAKTIRTAMCLWGYLECKDAEIIFASPKITPAIIKDLEPCMEDINTIFSTNGLSFKARIIANSDFNNLVLQPILLVSSGVADTSELFMRSYQMFDMFSHGKATDYKSPHTQNKLNNIRGKINYVDQSKYSELKIGKLAQLVLRKILESGSISAEELGKLQTVEYSKDIFDLQFPLLVKQGSDYDAVRYYAQPIKIHEEFYYLCSQWYETPSNNDRPFLIQWITDHE